MAGVFSYILENIRNLCGGSNVVSKSVLIDVTENNETNPDPVASNFLSGRNYARFDDAYNEPQEYICNVYAAKLAVTNELDKRNRKIFQKYHNA